MDDSCLFLYQVKSVVDSYQCENHGLNPSNICVCLCVILGCFEHHHPFLLPTFLLPRPAGLHHAHWRFHHCCFLRSQLGLLRGTQTQFFNIQIHFVCQTGIKKVIKYMHIYVLD